MKQNNLLVLFLATLLYLPATIHANWTLLIYADPCTDVTEAVIKKLTDLMSSYTSDQVTVYVQFRIFLNEDPERSYAWRYIVQNQSLVYVDTVSMDYDPVVNITNAMDWAFQDTRSEYQGIIISGHGSGILEPIYNDEYGMFTLEYEDDSQYDDSCSLRAERYPNKSILLNELNGSHINNDMMISVMAYGSQLLGKNIDLLGFDLCLGASIEHAYQLAPYVNYLVGCQNCALIDGFDFYQLGNTIQQGNCTPLSLAQDIVTSYSNYYEEIAPDAAYALSVLDLQQIAAVTQALDKFTITLMDLMIANPELIDTMIKIRKQSFHACFVPMYTDIYDFAELVSEQLIPQLSADDARKLKPMIDNLLQTIEQAVCGNVHGANLPNVHGMNIYYPYNNIEDNYFTTQFAQNTNWLNFLMFMTNNYKNSYR